MIKKTTVQTSYFFLHPCQSLTSGTRMVAVHGRVGDKTRTRKTTSYKTISYGTNYDAFPLFHDDTQRWTLVPPPLGPEYPVLLTFFNFYLANSHLPLKCQLMSKQFREITSNLSIYSASLYSACPASRMHL